MPKSLFVTGELWAEKYLLKLLSPKERQYQDLAFDAIYRSTTRVFSRAQMTSIGITIREQ
jgi:hypothetical protein